MTRKLIIAIMAGFGLMIASVTQLPAVTQYQYQQQLEEIPNEVLILVCQKLQEKKIASVSCALNWYRTGQMTITKEESGVYAVVTPGSGVVVLITDLI